MAKLYLQAGDDLVGAFKTAVANPNTEIVGANGKPISLQRLGGLAFNPNQTQEGIANSVAQQALVTQEVLSGQNPTQQGNSSLERDATNLGYQGDLTDTAAMQSFITAANQANANANVTKPSTDTLANLGGTGTVVDGNKINTQGNTGTQGSLNPYNTMDATGATPEKVVTPPVTPPVTGLTLADLQKQGYLTNDQLQSSLSANQTALTKQNEKFLTDWGTQADTWKAGVLTDVDTKNQAFGRQATQGFMDAFKNYQLPTNTAGVNMGNYNDNRTTAGDQWWSQYVTGRR